MKTPSTFWAQYGITHWLTEDLSVTIMKWERRDGCKIQLPKTHSKGGKLNV